MTGTDLGGKLNCTKGGWASGTIKTHTLMGKKNKKNSTHKKPKRYYLKKNTFVMFYTIVIFILPDSLKALRTTDVDGWFSPPFFRPVNYRVWIVHTDRSSASRVERQERLVPPAWNVSDESARWLGLSVHSFSVSFVRT